MRAVRENIQDSGVPQDSLEAAQQKIHLRHLRRFQGVQLRPKAAQEEAQSGVRDALSPLQQGLLHKANH